MKKNYGANYINKNVVKKAVEWKYPEPEVCTYYGQPIIISQENAKSLKDSLIKDKGMSRVEANKWFSNNKSREDKDKANDLLNRAKVASWSSLVNVEPTNSWNIESNNGWLSCQFKQPIKIDKYIGVTYEGTGKPQTIDLGFKPDYINISARQSGETSAFAEQFQLIVNHQIEQQRQIMMSTPNGSDIWMEAYSRVDGIVKVEGIKEVEKEDKPIPFKKREIY